MYTINPNRNTPWNGLPSLPIGDEYVRTLDILEKLGEAKAAMGMLQGRSAVLADQSLLISTISLQEAKQSSAIENVFTTDDELYKAFSKDHKERESGASKEVLRYREAIWHGNKYLEGSKAIDVSLIIELFQIIKNTKDTLRPNFADVFISRGGSEMGAGERIYTPPRGDGILEDKLNNLMSFLNNDEQFPIDPILKMIIGHLQFEAIHPFRDGNGRTGRILNVLYLKQQGLLDMPILYMSKYILRTKDQYYHTISGVTQRADWQNYILYMLDVVRVTSKDTYDKINRIMSAKEAIEDHIVKNTKIRNPQKLVSTLFAHPFTTTKHLTSNVYGSVNTARLVFETLIKEKILERVEISGHHYYKNIELYNILGE